MNKDFRFDLKDLINQWGKNYQECPHLLELYSDSSNSSEKYLDYFYYNLNYLISYKLFFILKNI